MLLFLNACKFVEAHKGKFTGGIYIDLSHVKLN